MPSEPVNRADLESRWQRNEIELRQLENTHGFDRELNCARIEELLAEQDRSACLSFGLSRWK